MPHIHEVLEQLLPAHGLEGLWLNDRTAVAWVPSEGGGWPWSGQWNEPQTLLICCSHLPGNVAPRRQPAVAQLLAGLNGRLGLGGWAMDLQDGEVTFCASLPLRAGKASRAAVQAVLRASLAWMHALRPAVQAVAEGRQSPRRALAQVVAENDWDPPAPVGPTRDERLEQLHAVLRRMERRHRRAKGNYFVAIGSDVQTPGQRERAVRFLQFCFLRDRYAMDLPRTTLTRRETLRLLKGDRGFFREAERAETGVTEVEDLLEYDPICKLYSYGEHRQAAQDAAYILFDLYRLDPAALLRVHAAPFDGSRVWEDHEVLG